MNQTNTKNPLGRYCIFYVIGHIVVFLSVCIILSLYV